MGELKSRITRRSRLIKWVSVTALGAGLLIVLQVTVAQVRKDTLSNSTLNRLPVFAVTDTDDPGDKQVGSPPIIISEFRLRGLSGANDEFIEIHNTTNSDHTVAAAGGTGYGIAASDGVTRCSIPNGTVIPGRGHFLCANSVAYSLGSYPANHGTTATADATYTTDIPDNAGIAIFNNNVGGSNYNLANRLDAVGSTSEANTLYKEGTGYPVLTPFSVDYSFYRSTCPRVSSTADPVCTPGDSGQAQDTNNNAIDFVFVDTNGTLAGAGQRLGAPAPENLSGPRKVDGSPALPGTLFDGGAALNAPPNYARDFTSDPANNSTFGTMSFRRALTNNSGANITRLRFRVIDLETFPAASGNADLRVRTSTNVVLSLSGGGTATALGVTLEQPPGQPNGGAFNSSLSVGTTNLVNPLAPGQTVNLNLLLGIQQTGSFTYCLNIETVPATSSDVVCFAGNTETGPIPPGTLTVTTPNNSGAGSLRQAILDANAQPGLQTIVFSIPGSGVHTISPTSALPAITSPVIIDGYTQPGSSANTLAIGNDAVLLIELDGSNAAGPPIGLDLNGATNCTVRGLVINRFDTGINISGAGSSNNHIEGNRIGTNPAGTTAAPNLFFGVLINSASGNTVGGTTPASRNLLSGNGSTGVSIQQNGVIGNLVQGNYIGTTAAGTADLGNACAGVLIHNAANNVIGGTIPGAGNVISGNNCEAVSISTSNLTFPSTGNLVQGNLIGTNASGAGAVGNGRGIVISDAGTDSNIIGGTASGAENVIAFNTGNGGKGVLIIDGVGNAILSNSIFSNSGLGIDLLNNDITANDACDADGPNGNNLQNFPVITIASTTSIQGTLNSTANTTFTLQFFSNSSCDASGNGQGQNFLGSTTVTTDGSCNTSFTFLTSLSVGQLVTATATDSSNNTSEFSQCGVVVESPTITGRLVNDSGTPIQGVGMVLSGTTTGNATTNASGEYSFPDLVIGGNYTVTPASGFFAFSPVAHTFNNLNVNRIANFVGTQSLVGISGNVTDGNNVPLNNITVNLKKNGVAAGSVQTNVLGIYSFPNQAAGANYSVTPVGSFVPSSQSFLTLTVNTTPNFKSVPSIPPQCNTASFATPTTLASGVDPHFVSVADLNSDSKLDLVVANSASNNVSIYTGTGTGGFSTPVNISVGAGPRSITLGDFNADGNVDLAVANANSDNVSILLGNGAGGFTLANNFATGAGPVSIVAAYFNGDQVLDLATVSQLGSVSILLGISGGSFSTATNFAAGTNPQFVTAGDFNEDGRVDLATANAASSSVSILLGSGTGSFGAATNFAAGSVPSHVAVGDFNNDSHLDLAVSSSNGVSLLLGTGTGSFGAATNVPSGASTNFAVVGDYNNDLKLDLAVTNQGANNVSVLLGQGNGNFAGATNFTVDIHPVAIAIGDFNGDGKFDLAATNHDSNNVSILSNNGPSCNSQTSLTISGQVKSAVGGPLADVAITLSGPITRVVTSDVNGNYSFPNLVPGGNYVVTVRSSHYVFAPSRADFFNLSSNQTVSFNAAPNAVPLPTPTLSDNFDSPTRDPERWNVGTQTQLVGAVDPQVTTTQVNGQLVIKPVAQAGGPHYNGYVSANSFDFRNGTVGVELVQPASGGADSIFAIGSDQENFARFVVHSAGGPSGVVSMVRGSDGQEQPLDTTIPQLIFQIAIGGQPSQAVSIPYDPVRHRHLRFRHEAPTNAIVFETSADNIYFRERHRVTLQKSVSALTAELSAGTPNPTNPGQTIFENFNLVTSTYQFSAANYTIGEGEGSIVITVTRQGNPGVSGTTATVEYQTTDGTAQQRSRYIPAVGTLTFAPGQMSRTFTVLVVDNVFTEGNQTVNLLLGNALGAGLNTPGRAVLTIVDNDTLQTASNPTDEATFFAQQHYLDFLNRAPDAAGLAFWANEITSCGGELQCLEVKRINVSAAFFLAIEFQETGYLVERIYKVAYGDGSGTSTLGGTHQLAVPVIRREEFLPDTQEIGLGVVVGVGDWQQHLEQNKVAFLNGFVQRTRFRNAYANMLTPEQYVGSLFQHAGLMPTNAELMEALAEFGGAQTSADLGARARALRRVAQNGRLDQLEFNRAFVLMQFFGYLRRNPNDPQDTDYTGYDFWLRKLNEFDGNFVNAEMVKAFISSAEYRNRFGP